MHTPTISLITPTIGRSTLARTARSVLPQLSTDDEWLIVADARREIDLPSLTATTGGELGLDRVTWLTVDDPRSAFGNAQRNAGMQRARNELLMFVDDDDWLLPGALDVVRREGASGVPMMFRMDYRPRNCLLWRTPILREANVGGGMFVVPNRRERLACWPVGEAFNARDIGASDFTFIERTLQLWPAGSLRWCRDVIYCCPNHGRGQ